MGIDKEILKELTRYNKINNYISEQEATLPPAPEAAPETTTPTTEPTTDAGLSPEPPTTPTGTTKVDLETDPDVEKVNDKNVKEIEVTDLVKTQKNVEEKQEEYFDGLFKHLNDLEEKLSVMDTIVDKLNNLENKIEKYRVKTPEEKLELRSLDSGPFNQKLTDFFEDKEVEMEKSGKNEYVLTQDEIESYSPHDIRKSFRNFEPTEPEKNNAFTRIS